MLDRLTGRFLTPKETGMRGGLQQIFDARKPTLPRYDNLTGTPAALCTNEVAPAGFVEAVRKMKPDGYIIAAGAGLSFALPSFFPEGVAPKGIVIADINPGVVAVGRVFVEELQKSSTFDKLHKDLLGLTFSEIKAKAIKLAETDPDREYSRRAVDALSSQHRMLIGATSPDSVDIVGAVRENFDLLRKLAKGGNIVVNFADITDPDFISTVQSIPDFSEGTNMVYISNIRRYAELREEDDNMHRLAGYAQGAKGVVVIDSDHERDYQLQVHGSFSA